MISKSLSTSERFASLNRVALGEFCQVLYPLLNAHADDHGRLAGDAFTVKHLVLPTSPRSLDEFAQALVHLHSAGLIQLYVIGHQTCIQIPGFDFHQTGLSRRTPSKYPAISADAGIPVKFTAIHSELNLTELKGTKENGTPPAADLATTRPSGVLVGMLPRDHLKHAACDPSFSRCVPTAVHDKFVTTLTPKYAGNRAEASAALLAWYPSVWATLPADFVMPDAFRFWQPRFDAVFASRDGPVGSKRISGLTVGGTEFLQRRQSRP